MGAVAVGVWKRAPEPERPMTAAPMHIVVELDSSDDVEAVIDLRDHEERLIRRDVLLLEVEAARLRRRSRRGGGLHRGRAVGSRDAEHPVPLGATDAFDRPVLARSAG